MAKGQNTAHHPGRKVDREAMAHQASLKARLPQLHPQQMADLRQRTEIREEHYKAAHPDLDRYDDED